MLWRGHVHSAGCGKRRLPGARLGLGTRLSPRYFLLGSVIGCQRSRRLTIPGAGPPQNKEPQTRSHCLQGDIASWGQTGGEVRTPPSYFLLGSVIACGVKPFQQQILPKSRSCCLQGPRAGHFPWTGRPGHPLACLLPPDCRAQPPAALSPGAVPKQGGPGQSCLHAPIPRHST